MAERLKSRVLHREEKFMGTVTMSRFLACVLSTGASYFVLRLLGLGAINIIVSMLVFAGAVFLTGDRYGLMRYHWYLLQVRGQLLLDAHQQPQSLLAQIVQMLAIETHVVVQGSQLFKTADMRDDDLSGFIVLDSDDLDASGFEVLGASDISSEHSP